MDIFEKCIKDGCNNNAVWYYMPSSSIDRYYCDDHVPRDCTCNYESTKEGFDNNPPKDYVEGFDFIWVTPNEVWQIIDDKKRPYPCCEFDYNIDKYRKPFGEYEMANQIIDFIKSNKKNTYLYNEFITVYVRNSVRLIEGDMIKCIDIGNITVKEEYQNIGIFTELMNYLETLIEINDNKRCIFVESILNPIISKILNNNSYKLMPGEDINMYKKCGL